MAKGFASTTDLGEKKVTFSEIGTDLYAFTAEGDPNSAVIVGEDGCMVFDAQATPAMANKVIERVRTVTDKPIKYVEHHAAVLDRKSTRLNSSHANISYAVFCLK